MSGEELAGESPWVALQRAREAVGITQREVADALHLPISTIDAIEHGDKTRLPAHVFTRGYVRAYAKLLELDPDPLITALAFDQGDVEPTETASTGTVPISTAEILMKLRQPPVMIGAAVALVALILLFVTLGSGEDAPVDDLPAAASVSTTDQEAAASEGAAALEAPDMQVDAAAVADEFVAEPQAVETVGFEADTGPAAAEAAPAALETSAAAPSSIDRESVENVESAETAETAASTDPARRLTPDGDDRLTLVFSEDCWVEIKDTAGVQLYGDLGRGGQTLEFVGAGPYRVLLGYAPGVVLLFNEEPIALTPHTRNNVANLVLGQ